VNLKPFLDGSDDYGVMPVTVGDKPHSYHWMPYRVGQAAKAEELEEVRRVMLGFVVLQVFLIVLFFSKKEGRK
jgi:hypothetical protein